MWIITDRHDGVKCFCGMNWWLLRDKILRDGVEISQEWKGVSIWENLWLGRRNVANDKADTWR